MNHSPWIYINQDTSARNIQAYFGIIYDQVVMNQYRQADLNFLFIGLASGNLTVLGLRCTPFNKNS